MARNAPAPFLVLRQVGRCSAARYLPSGVLERSRVSANIEDLTCRACRTTFATSFNGYNKDAQEILGHHSPAFTLAVYRRPIATRKQRAVNALDRRLNVVPMRKKRGAA